MNKLFISRLSVLLILLSGFITLSQAQDSVKKASAVKKVITKPVAGSTAALNPATGKPWGYYSGPHHPTGIKTAHFPDTQRTAVAPAAAASKPAAPPVDKSLRGQYKYLLTKVYGYQQPFVAALWKNFMDTLNKDRSELKIDKAKLDAQGKTIGGLQADITNKDQTLAVSNSKVDSINFIGMDLTKSAYNLLMWGLVVVFGATAAIVIARSGSNKREADYRIKLYNELEEEFKTYKTKANEKEKKLARELQTERNKLDELTGRG